MALMALEVGLLALLFRRLWLFATAGLVAAGVMFVLYVYPQVGPVVDRNLNAAHHPQTLHLVTSTDPSLREHVGLLGYDLEYVRMHPLGTGLGSAVHRFGLSQVVFASSFTRCLNGDERVRSGHNLARISPSIACEMALRCSGRSSVIDPTAPSRAERTSANP